MENDYYDYLRNLSKERLEELKERLEVAVPWVGGYIAAASAVCTLAMAADAFNSFRHKKLWFPCKYFCLNATSLTLLSVAMKLPMDLNTVEIYEDLNSLARFSSLTLMLTAMANFMSSLGSMNDQNILPNVIALGILVITIAANVVIRQILVSVPFYILFSMILMLLLLATLFSLAITVPTIKRSLESKYQEKHKVALMEEKKKERRGAFRIEDQRRHMMKYWVMAETSSPHFVMARSVVCTTSPVICLIALITSLSVYILYFGGAYNIAINLPSEIDPAAFSPYKESITWILFIQCTGVAVGTIAPLFRWFVVVSFKCSTINRNSFKIKVEPYWIQTLKNWRDSFSPLHIRRDSKCRKYLHNAKWFAITLCIGLQIWTVLLSKLFVFLSALLVWPLFLCFTLIKNFAKQTEEEADSDKDSNLSDYVLLLEGEANLPRRVLKNICDRANSMIQTGQKKQPQNLENLLYRFVNFNGVGQFDINEIPSLHSKEPPNCWTLPVATLTSIAIALPNIAEHKVKRLLSRVSEGLSLAKIVEKKSDETAQLVNIREAADVTWTGVVLYMRWQDIDVKKKSLECKNSRKVLQNLSSKAQGIVAEFKEKYKDPLMENPLCWPPEVVAANSMYRISETILLSCEGENKCTDEGLFERLLVMIADILAACLTNLPHVITTMCHRNCIEKREKRVRKAFLLLGKTEQVVELLQQQEWPALDHDKAADIEEWRAWFRENKDDPAASTSRGSTPTCSGEHLAITVAR